MSAEMVSRNAIGPDVIGGLPAHPLLVHAAVVLIPLAAITLITSAVWPAARRKLTWITPLLGVAALVAVPLTTQSGEWLAERVGETPLVEMHEELAEGLLPWVGGLAVWSVLVWLREFSARRREPANDTSSSPARAVVFQRLVAVVVVVGAIAFSAGSVMQVYRVGESGSRAVWTDTASGQ